MGMLHCDALSLVDGPGVAGSIILHIVPTVSSAVVADWSL